jgi:FKBP-type peptidyl-prolyl cis-trans isomerase FklB
MAARLIPGWKEALTMMNAGSEWEIYIPGSLAYGERGMPQGGIGPDATLIFKVQLVSIKSNMPPPPSMQQRPGQ